MRLTMVGRLDPCFLFSYAIEPCQAKRLLPPGLALVTYCGCAFLNIVVCRVDRMRPRFAPGSAGITYWHVAYRLHVRATLDSGRPLEGLYFLRSDVDHRLLGTVGNWLTDFRLHYAEITFSRDGIKSFLEVEGTGQGLGEACLRMCSGRSDSSLAGSPFASFEERERALKYQPLSMAVCGPGRHLRLAEVSREESAWREEPVAVEHAEWAYPRSQGLDALTLVRATQVKPIEYGWRLGRRERIRPALKDGWPKTGR